MPMICTLTLMFHGQSEIDYKIDCSRSITKGYLDTNYITQSIGLRGDLSITKNWKISYMTNYDFIRKEFSFTSI